jgi:hypothetical protein
MKHENEIFVVIAYRWGDSSAHSYTVGVYNREDKARKAAQSHHDYRGGKYACVVEMCFLNRNENDDDEYSKEVFRAKSSMGL